MIPSNPTKFGLRDLLQIHDSVLATWKLQERNTTTVGSAATTNDQKMYLMNSYFSVPFVAMHILEYSKLLSCEFYTSSPEVCMSATLLAAQCLSVYHGTPTTNINNSFIC